MNDLLANNSSNSKMLHPNKTESPLALKEVMTRLKIVGMDPLLTGLGKIRLTACWRPARPHGARMKSALIGIMLFAMLPVRAADLDFLKGHVEFEHTREMLPSYLNRIAMKLISDRESAVAAMSSQRDLDARRRDIRERILRLIGGLPARTPLNAQRVGTLDRNGYTVEKIVFQSQPDFYVTANLYLPKSGRPPFPAVLFPLGHEAGSKAHSTWQKMLITLARKGYVALTWDPVGQGERGQFYNPDLEDSDLGHLRYTSEHTMLGLQCLLVGDNLARYTVWDGIRALDYLLSRPEVDPKRVAVTGNSGGGTHSAYLAALDGRISVVAPSCYITSWRQILNTIGPQDSEQVIQSWLAEGLDYADLVYAANHKPYLILSAIRDFFSISGARATFSEVSRTLARVDAPSSGPVAMFEADDGHGYSAPRREAAYRWLARWLKNNEDTAPEAPVVLESEKELQVTTTGQVSTSFDSETVFSLNQKRLPQRKLASKNELQARVRELTGYEHVSGRVETTSYGSVNRDSYRIDKFIYQSEPGIYVPSLLFVPREKKQPMPAVIYVNGKGKSADAEQVGEIEKLVARGAIVLAIEPRGMGETAVTEPPDGQHYSGYFGDYADSMRAVLLRKTLVGMRAADISRAVDFLAARADVDPKRIFGVGKGTGSVILLHAAALDLRIRKMILDQMTISYESIVRNRIHRECYESLVPGVLGSYDLPELAASLAPRRVWIVEPVNPLGNAVGANEARRQYAPFLDRFQASEYIRIVDASQRIEDIYGQLLR